MMAKKQFTLLFCVFLFAVLAYQAQPVKALPFDHDYTNEPIAAGNHVNDTYVLTTGDEISGYYETSLDTQGLDFFICDSANYTIWDTGGSAIGFESATYMHTYGFSFIVPYSDTWHLVYDNTDGAIPITFDRAIDVNGVDNSPFYDSSSYTYTAYGQILEDDEYYYVSATLAEGSIVDGHFATFFTTDGLDFAILDQANFDDFESGFSATGYSVETDMHQSPIDEFTIPTSGVWYFVFHAAAEGDTVTFSYGIDIDTTNAVSGPGIAMLSVIGLVAGLLILLILCCVCRSKKKDPDFTPSQPTTDHYVAPSPARTETVREREIVRDRVLVICPYCGSKNEQGITTCANCDAEL